MKDPIERADAIDAVNAWLLLRSLNRTMSNVTSIQDVLRQLPSAQPQRWIPCSERLPEEYGDYLVTMELTGWNLETYRTIDVAYFDTGWHIADMVLAWMPLPEPYAERREE